MDELIGTLMAITGLRTILSTIVYLQEAIIAILIASVVLAMAPRGLRLRR